MSKCPICNKETRPTDFVVDKNAMDKSTIRVFICKKCSERKKDD